MTYGPSVVESLARLQLENDDLRAQRDELTRVLLLVEWCIDEGHGYECPVCHGGQPGGGLIVPKGHTPDCALDAAFAIAVAKDGNGKRGLMNPETKLLITFKLRCERGPRCPTGFLHAWAEIDIDAISGKDIITAAKIIANDCGGTAIELLKIEEWNDGRQTEWTPYAFPGCHVFLKSEPSLGIGIVGACDDNTKECTVKFGEDIRAYVSYDDIETQDLYPK